eukprot:gnl/MRDRNA2_/MRDRNA2_135099_c0_seq1.p1 gnl/MRDRNA2_/MRDRNA2_135099_c0~~gnl/MRDRNA2_/MRDRNA2_135099_c0_seq1.p1  ORF type:complete len:547 (+),score=107.57 gnl/MRDRNA2_/MRDRNA2_135099_c0_seq1:131-1771(+)
MADNRERHYFVALDDIDSQPTTSKCCVKVGIAFVTGMCLMLVSLVVAFASIPTLQNSGAAKAISLVSMRSLRVAPRGAHLPSGPDVKAVSQQVDPGKSSLSQLFGHVAQPWRRTGFPAEPYQASRQIATRYQDPSASGSTQPRQTDTVTSAPPLKEPSQDGETTGSAPETANAGHADDEGSLPPPSNKQLDTIIDAFMRYQPEEWVKLMIYSNSWFYIAPFLFKRIEERAAKVSPAKVKLEKRGDGLDKDKWIGERESYMNLLEGVKARHLKVVAQDELLQQLKQCPSKDLPQMVASIADQISVDDFVPYAQGKVELAMKVGDTEQADALANLLQETLVVLTPGAKDLESVPASTSTQRLQRILEGDRPKESAQNKSRIIMPGQTEAASGFSRYEMYSTGRDTDMTEEQFRDVQLKGYLDMVEANERLLPVETRILKKLFNTDDPKRREYILNEAFQPPPIAWNAELSDDLYSTPALMVGYIAMMLQMCDQMAQAGGRAGSGSDLILPGTEHEATGVMGGYSGLLVSTETVMLLRELQELLMKRYF